MNARMIAALVALALAGCSGGGAVTPPAAPAPVASSASSSTQSTTCAKTKDGTKQTCSLTIVIPLGKTAAKSAATRALEYVSPSTASITVAIATTPIGMYTFTPGATLTFNIAQMSCVAGAGTQTCTAALPPFGLTTYEALIVNAYDGPNGTGNLLASNQVDQGPGNSYFATLCGITLGNQNVCTANMGGVPASYVVAQATPFTSGTPGTSSLSVTAYDADGNPIVAGGSTLFAGPFDGGAGLTLVSTAPSHISFSFAGSGCSLSAPSTVSVFGPTCSITLVYDGTATFESAPISLDLENGYASLGSSTTVYDYNSQPIRFYPTKLPSACSSAASLTVLVPAIQTYFAGPLASGNGAPSC